MRRALACSLALALPVAACARGCGEDRPWTPYRIDASAGASASPAPAVTLPPAASAFARLAAVRPQAATGPLALDGLLIEPAPNERVALVLSGDLDADGDRDLAAWLVDDAGAGRLVLVARDGTGSAPARELARLAAPAAGCAAEPTLSAVGPRTLALVVARACVSAAGGSASREMQLVAARTVGEPALVRELRFAAPRKGEALSVEADGADADADGRDDLVVRVAVEGGPPPIEPATRTVATLRWLDRPTGLARDPDEPAASLRAAADAVAAIAARKTEAGAVRAGVRGVAALAGVLVAAGELRTFPARADDDLAYAEARARLAAGDVLGAHVAWARRPKVSSDASARRAELDKLLAKSAPLRVATSRALAVVADADPPPGTTWGPLAFDASGALRVRVRGDAGVVVDASGADHVAPELWSPVVASADGATLVGLATPDNCAAAPMCLAVAGADGGGARLVALPLLPLPSGDAPADAVVEPIAVGPAGLELRVGGVPVRLVAAADRAELLDYEGSVAPVSAGSPRSPDGRTAAFALGADVLVRAPAGWQRWHDAAAATSAPFTRCTAADDARAVACARAGGAVVVLEPAKR